MSEFDPTPGGHEHENEDSNKEPLHEKQEVIKDIGESAVEDVVIDPESNAKKPDYSDGNIANTPDDNVVNLVPSKHEVKNTPETKLEEGTYTQDKKKEDNRWDLDKAQMVAGVQQAEVEAKKQEIARGVHEEQRAVSLDYGDAVEFIYQNPEAQRDEWWANLKARLEKVNHNVKNLDQVVTELLGNINNYYEESSDEVGDIYDSTGGKEYWSTKSVDEFIEKVHEVQKENGRRAKRREMIQNLISEIFKDKGDDPDQPAA